VIVRSYVPGTLKPALDLDLDEISIATLQARLSTGELTARTLVEAYLERIEAFDRSGPMLRSVIETNPDALRIADELDRERAERGSRGALHGIPILLKDNIDTADGMQTTAGSLALVGARVERDSTVARKLREAGAVLLGKTNLSEWANFRSTRSSSGWSGRGRQTRNPYVLDRSPGGSSSGSGAAVAANLAAAALGTETDGSIVSPSSACGIVGIKPTVGLTSRSGVIPISHTQDTVGPHTRSVADAALVLSAISETQHDASGALNADSLRGARIGVLRETVTGYNEHTDRVFEAALAVLRDCGAELIDPVEVPGLKALCEPFKSEEKNSELIGFEYELKAGLAAYFAARPDARVRTLADVIAFNEEHAAEEMPYFRQEHFLAAETRGPLTDELYQQALEHNRNFAAGYTAVYADRQLDAIVSPTNAPAWTIDLFDGDRDLGGSSRAAALSGCPLVTVPAGFVADLLPIGLTFMGRAWSESTLIGLAYAFEQACPMRRAPRFVPTTLDLP
jgi:amidase